MSPVIEGVVAPTETTVNSTLDIIEIIPLVGTLIPDLSINTTSLLSSAAAGEPITLQALDENGDPIGPDDECGAVADSFRLASEGGLSIGGNRITGLGAEGSVATAGEIDSIAFGNNAATDATAISSIAIGTDAAVGAGATGSVALGDDAAVNVANSVAIGAGSRGLRGMSSSYTALGVSGTQSSVGEVSFGAAGAERQLTNVAAGSEDTDAVNVAQLRGVSDRVDTVETASALSVQYDDAGLDSVSLGNSGTPVTLSNVAAGTDDNDAVNVAQLTGVSDRVDVMEAASALSVQYDDAGLDSVTFGNSGTPVTLSNVAAGTDDNDAVNVAQLTGVSDRVDTIEAVSALAVQYDSAALDMITLGLAGTPVVITNLADGSLAAGSADAVTGGQVNALGTSIAAGLGGGVGFDEMDGSLSAPSFTVNGVAYSSVGDAIGALNAAAGGTPSGDLGPVGTTAAQLFGGGVTFNTTTQQLEGPFTVYGTAYNSVQEAMEANNALDVLYDDASFDLLTLAGLSGTRLTNLMEGVLSSSSTDAVTGAQLFATNELVTLNTQSILNLEQQFNLFQQGGGGGGQGSMPVAYADPATPTEPNDGTQTDNVTFVGASDSPVTVSNVADGDVSQGSTEAVNGNQLWQTNQNVATAQATADQALTLSSNSVQYDAGGQSVTFGPASGPVRLQNVARGVAPTDAVNVQQLNEGLSQAVDDAVAQANTYTNSVFEELTIGVRALERRANAGTASAMAAASLPQAVSTGKNVLSMGVGLYENQHGVAVGYSRSLDHGQTIINLGGNYNSEGNFGASAGVGWQF